MQPARSSVLAGGTAAAALDGDPEKSSVLGRQLGAPPGTTLCSVLRQHPSALYILSTQEPPKTLKCSDVQTTRTMNLKSVSKCRHSPMVLVLPHSMMIHSQPAKAQSKIKVRWGRKKILVQPLFSYNIDLKISSFFSFFFTSTSSFPSSSSFCVQEQERRLSYSEAVLFLYIMPANNF